MRVLFPWRSLTACTLATFLLYARASAADLSANVTQRSILLGMLEGTLKGSAAWDGNRKEQTTCFVLGPGEMLVANAGQRPVVVQFDLPRFIQTSPLITTSELSKAVAAYKADARRGFIEPCKFTIIGRGENVVRTEPDSDQTLVRKGFNSIFFFYPQAHALNFIKGAFLFSKPANSGRVELRVGAITAAITGGTGFISNLPAVPAMKLDLVGDSPHHNVSSPHHNVSSPHHNSFDLGVQQLRKPTGH